MTTLPLVTPETRHFWEGARRGELLLQKCSDCGHVYFPPRPFCPRCASKNVKVFAASGRATLYSYVINHRSPPGWPKEPFSIAIVSLAEGPKMVTNIVECSQTPEALVLNMPLIVTFKKLSDDISVPVFRPAESVS